MLLVHPGQPERGIVTRDREDRYCAIALLDPLARPRPCLRAPLSVYLSLQIPASVHLVANPVRSQPAVYLTSPRIPISRYHGRDP
jgi:hypothetical protein